MLILWKNKLRFESLVAWHCCCRFGYGKRKSKELFMRRVLELWSGHLSGPEEPRDFHFPRTFSWRNSHETTAKNFFYERNWCGSIKPTWRRHTEREALAKKNGKSLTCLFQISRLLFLSFPNQHTKERKRVGEEENAMKLPTYRVPQLIINNESERVALDIDFPSRFFPPEIIDFSLPSELTHTTTERKNYSRGGRKQEDWRCFAKFISSERNGNEPQSKFFIYAEIFLWGCVMRRRKTKKESQRARSINFACIR